MHKTLILSLAGLALTLAAAPVKAEDIKIAVVGPMTGPVATIGEQQKRGAEAAAAAINAAGGVMGRNIQIVVEDDACDPKQAVAVANLIVGLQIKFVAGHACSGSSIPAADVYADNNVLMMSPASSNPALTEKGHPTIMRLYGRDDAQGAFIAPFIAEKFKGKTIAILHDKSAYGKGLATVVKETLNAAGVKEVLFDGINPGEKDYNAIVTKLEVAGRRGGLFRRVSYRSRSDSPAGRRPGLQVQPDHGRQPGDGRVLGHRRPGGRGNDVHLPDRPAPFADRGQGARAVQGAELRTRGLHALQLRRHPGDRRGDQAGRFGRPGQGRQGAERRAAGGDGPRPDQVRQQGRHRGSALRHQPLARREIRADRPVGA